VGYYGNNSVHTVADPVNGSWSYGYDKFNRIETASCSGDCPYGSSSQTLGFTYDQYGNRWTQTASPTGFTPSFSFNTKNQITSASGVVYDTDGNLTNDGNGNTFSFDHEGKLTASVVGGVSSTYKNDPFGHRAESVTSAGTFDYVYDPSGRLITEADTTCNSGAPYYPCTDFVYIGASSIPFSQFSDWVCCAAYATFNYYDYMGSLRETTSYAGLSGPYKNDPFGDIATVQPSWFGFAEMLTLGSGVQLSSTRGYHQIEARWLSPDPSGMAAVDTTNPQSWNRYGYVLNNPVSVIDPLGLDCIYPGDDPDSTAYVKSGDCDDLSDKGYFVDGTVDLNSQFFENSDGGLEFLYTDDNGNTGLYVLAGYADPQTSDDSDFTPSLSSQAGMLAIANVLNNYFPTACSFSLSARVSAGGFGVGVNSTQSGTSVSFGPTATLSNSLRASVGLSTNGVGAPDPGSTIRVGSLAGGLAFNPTNGQIGGYVGKSVNVFGKETGATLTATVGKIGTNSSCAQAAHK
jgi:RHS repeat-associated protein